MKWSKILLIIGLAILLAGCIMSYMQLQPYSDYMLVAGAVIVIFRGAIHSHEKANTIKPAEDAPDEPSQDAAPDDSTTNDQAQ